MMVQPECSILTKKAYTTYMSESKHVEMSVSGRSGVFLSLAFYKQKPTGICSDV